MGRILDKIKSQYGQFLATWRAEKSRIKPRDRFLFTFLFLVVSILTVLGFQNCAPTNPQGLTIFPSSAPTPKTTPRPRATPTPVVASTPVSTPIFTATPTPRGSTAPTPTPRGSPSPTPTRSPSPSMNACANAQYASTVADYQVSPTIHPTDKRRLMLGNKIWWPTGSYGFAFNMMDNAGNSSTSEDDLLGRLRSQGRGFIDMHANANLTLVKFWINWGSVSQQGGDNDWDKNVLTPYARTGSGTALDGKPKVNLNQWNDRYFNLLQELVDYAKDRKIVMQLMLLDCWHSGQYGERWGNAERDFYKSANNSSGIDWSSRSQWFQTSGNIWNQHEKFVKKVIDVVGSRPNIIWEGCNENTENVAFDGAIANLVRAYEASKGFPRHLIVGPTQSGSTNIDIQEHMKTPGHKTPGAERDFEAPSIMRDAFLTNPMVQGRPVISDNDCCAGQPSSVLVRHKMWLALTGGSHVNIFNNDFYSARARGNSNTAAYFSYLGHLHSFLQNFKVNLVGMIPAPNNSTVVDANVSYAYHRGQDEYIIYLPNGGTTELRSRPSNYTAAWFDPRTGRSILAGQGPSFTTPNAQDWVLYVKAVPAGQSCQLPVTGSIPSYAPPQLAITKTFPGFPHTPNLNDPSTFQKIVSVDVPPNQSYRRLEFEIDVRIGSWNSDWMGNTDKDWHNIYWIQRGNRWSENGNGNVFGYMNIIKRGGQELNVQHSVQGNESTKMFQIGGTVGFNENTTYKFKHVYDAEKAEIHVYAYQGSNEVMHRWGPAYAAEILTQAVGQIQLGVGHRTDEEGPETPTPGWTYSNPVVRLYQ